MHLINIEYVNNSFSQSLVQVAQISWPVSKVRLESIPQAQILPWIYYTLYKTVKRAKVLISGD